MRLHLPHKFKCRNYQEPFWIAMNGDPERGIDPIDRACLVWHRRSGKDKTVENFLICRMIDRVANYYYLFPTGKQGRKVIWEGIDRDGFKYMDHFPKELIARKREDEMFIQLINGSTFQIIGTDNYDAIMGANPAGIVFSEYSLQDPMAWDYLRPILAENGGWAVFVFTPRGENHGFTLYEMAKNNPKWFCELLTARDTLREDGVTPVISEEIIQEERDSGMSEDMIQQEFYCSFKGGIEGAYYGKLLIQAEDDGRICNVPHDPASAVYTFWDLGIDDFTSVWFMQFIGPQIHVIDYYEKHGEGVDHYAQMLTQRHLDLGYNYGDHYGPHDIEARQFTKDGAKSFKTMMKELGYNFKTVKRSPNVNDGIRQVRARLPLMWFDETKCDRGLKCLRNYIQEFDEKKKKYSDRPLHNWASHGADAMRTYAEGINRLGTAGSMTAADAAALEAEYGPQNAMQV